MWCLPPKQDARFVAAMEDVLDVYARPYDAARPVLCLDEGAKQLLAQVRDVLPMKPAQPLRFDNEYERHGTCVMAPASWHLRPVPGVRASGGQTVSSGA
jgi:hypothetical protein